MKSSVIFAREKWLRKDGKGLMYPYAVGIYIIFLKFSGVYFEKLNKKAKDLYIELYSMYEKYFSCLNIYKREEKKKISEEEKSKNEIYDDLLIEVDNYNVWKSTLFDNFNDNISEEEFTELVNISKSFKLQTSFLEKFRNILKNFRKENIPLYRHTLFEGDINTTIESKQLNAINKFKKNK